MKVRITRAFRWSPDGIEVRPVSVGDVVEGRPAVVALRNGWGVEDAPPRDEGERSLPAAPVAAAVPRSPSNKRRGTR